MSEDTADAGITAFDVTDIWNSEDPIVTVPGEYYLSDDVKSCKALVIAAPIGETITIDFAGHSAVVEGNVDCAVDVSQSLGEVVLTDSTRQGADAISSRVILRAHGATSAVSAVKANYPDNSDVAFPKLSISFLSLAAELLSVDPAVAETVTDCYGVYANSGADGKPADVTIADCAVSAEIASEVANLDEGEAPIPESKAGLAASLFVATPGLVLDGTISSHAVSAGGACDLYAVQAPAAMLTDKFTPKGDFSVYAGGNEPDALALLCDNAASEPLAEHIIDATDQNLRTVSVDGGVVFALQDSANNREDDAEYHEVDAEDGAYEAPDTDGAGADLATAESDESLNDVDTVTGEPDGVVDKIENAGNTPMGTAKRQVGPMATLGLGATTQSIAAGDSATDLKDTAAATAKTAKVLDPGSYYLSDDLTIAKGFNVGTGTKQLDTAEVKIDLRGHTLTIGDTTTTARNIAFGTTSLFDSGVNLTIFDSTATSGHPAGTLLFSGAKASGGIKLNQGAGTLTLDGVHVKKSYADNSSSLYTTGVIYMTSSSTDGVASANANYEAYRRCNLKIDNCAITTDYSALTGRSNGSGWHNAAAPAIALESAGSVNDVVLNNSSITCVAPTNGLTQTNGAIDAYAIYFNATDGPKGTASSPKTRLVLKDSVLTVASAAGGAYGIAYGAQPVTTEITGATKFNVAAAAAKDAFGILADSTTGAVLLNGSLSYDATAAIVVGADTYTCSDNARKAAIATSGSGSTFIIGSGFSGALLPFAIDASSDTANAIGLHVAKFSDDVSLTADAARQAFAPAAFAQSKPLIDVDSEGIVLKVNPATAEALIGETYYGTFAEAVKAVKGGETIKLNLDLDSASFGVSDAEKDAEDATSLAFSVDLNGKKLGSFNCTSNAKVTLMSSASEQPVLSGSAADQSAPAIGHAGKGALTIDKTVSVNTVRTTSDATGISCTGGGTVIADGVSVAATSQAASAVGYDIAGSATITGGTVVATSASGSATGVSGSTGAVSLSGVAVTAQGGGEEICAVFARAGSGTVAATNSTLNALLTAARDSGNVDAVLGYGGKAKVTLTGCTLAAAHADDVNAGSVAFSAVRDPAYLVNARPSSAGEFVFAGKNTLKTESMAFSGLRAPLVFGADASFEGASASEPLLVSTGADLPEDVFAQLSESATGSLADLKSIFKVAEGDRYEDWELRAADDGNRLFFYTDAVAYIARGKQTKYFGTLAQAVAGSEAGETIVMRLDAPASAPFAVAKDITLDLAGYSVGISGSHLAGAGLVSVANGTAFTLKDSKRDDPDTQGAKLAGKLTLTVTGTNAGGYGMYVSPSAKLAVEGAAIDVFSAAGAPIGSTGADAELAIAGILVAAGTDNAVSFKGAKLSVSTRKSAVSTDYGATSAYGILINGNAAAGTAPIVQMDASSSIIAESNGAFQNAGRIIVPNESDLSATSGLQSARLRRIYPDEGSQLYKDIAAKFRQVAKYDGSELVGTLPTGSSVYSAGIYYAAPLVVDGSAYWVFSESIDDPGDASKIVPAAIYAQSTYQLPPTAVGVGSIGGLTATGMKRDLAVGGSIAAVSANGDSYAVRLGAGASGSWSFDGASLSATSNGASPYRGLGEKIVLNDVLDLNNDTVEFYPKNVEQLEVTSKLPEAHAVADNSGGKARIALAGQSNIMSKVAHNDGVAGADIVESDVADADPAKTNPVVIGQGFGLADGSDNPLSIVGEDGTNRMGDVFAKAGEGVELTTQQRTMLSDATGECNVVLDTAANTLSWGGTITVRFVDMYGNELASAEGVKDGQAISLPSALQLVRERDATMTYDFVGWSANENAQADGSDIAASADASTVSVEAALATDGVLVYYPVYRSAPVTVNVVFRGARDSDGNAIAEGGGTVPAGSTLKAAKSNGTLTVPVASDYATGEGEARITYVFAGWAAGANVYDADELMENVATSTASENAEAVYTAQYVAAGHDQYVAKFKVEKRVYAYAEQVGTAPTYAKADNTASLGYPEKPQTTAAGTTYAFAGWLKGYSNDYLVDSPSKMTYGRTDALPGAVSGESILFTAGFTTAKTRVNVQFCYYVKNEAGTWVFTNPNLASPLSCEYGSDPINLVRDKAVSFNQDGQSYTFLGWSTRYNDKTPMYTNDTGLPPAGNSGLGGSTTYWGVYRIEDQTAAVTFKYDGGSCKATGVAYNASIADAFEATGADKPGAAADGRKFIGWSDAEGAAEYLPDTNAIKDYVDAQGTAAFYAVYAELNSRKVVLDYNNGGEGTYKASVTDAGKIVLPSGWYNPSKEGTYFDGWSERADAAAADFDVASDTLREGVERLYAVYRPIAVDVPADGAVSADVSGLHVNVNGAMASGAVVLGVNEEKSPDAALAGNLKSGEQALQSFSVSVSYVDSRDGDEIHLNKGFGKAVLTFSLPSSLDGRPVKVYWLKADGSIGSVTSAAVESQDISTQAAGRTVEVTIDNYADSATGGNILLASTLTQAEQQLAQTVSNGLDALNNAMRAIDAAETNYTPANYDAAVAAYEDGVAKVQSAKTAQEAADAANAALDAMDAVPTLSGLNAAKADALQKLADAYSGYSKSSYTDANWEALVAAYNKAKAAVNAAASAGDANKAGSEGVVAMSAVKAGGTSSGGNGATNANGSSSTGNDNGAGDGNKDNNGAGASSGSTNGGSGSGLSSGNGSGSGTGGSSGLSSGGSSGISSSGASGLSSGGGSGISSSGTSGLSSSGDGAVASNGKAGAVGNAGEQKLGATLLPVTAELAKEKGLSKTGGLYVSSVEPGGPADAAGLQAGDVIWQVDGKNIDSIAALNDALSGKEAGSNVTVSAERNGEVDDYVVTLGEITDEEAAYPAAGIAGANGADGDDGLNGAGDARPGLLGDAEEADGDAAGFNYVPLIVAGALLLAAVAGLIAWLMRRRNEGLTDEGDGGGLAAPGAPALQL